MTLTKLALTVLGTIGLTAGTVLAVSEPTPAPLPAALAEASTGGCAGSACASSKCASAGCPLSAASIAATAHCAEKCSAQKCSADQCPAPPSQSEPIAAEVCVEHHLSAPVGTRCGTCVAAEACSSKTASLFDADGICRKHFCAETADSVCPSKGHVLLAGTCSEKCANTVCTADGHCDANTNCEASACEGECPVAAAKATRRFTLGIGLSTGGPIIHVAAGPKGNDSQSKDGCSAASVAGRFVLSLMNKTSCEDADACRDETREITATACEAKSTCATATCPTSKCASVTVAECSQSECRADSHCCCTSMECRCPGCQGECDQSQAASAPSILHLRDIVRDAAHPEWRPTTKDEVAHKYFAATPGLPPVFHHEEPSPGFHTFTFEPSESSPSESGSVGRVRVAHGPIHFFPRPDVRALPQIAQLPHGHRIRLSGFAAPVAAPQPPRAISPRLEGTWSRAAGDATSSFTFQNGRASGTWQVANGIEIRFSGTCTVTKDEQFIGIIDEIEAKGNDAKSFQAHMLVQRLVDQPFAVRFVADGESLILKDIRCSGLSPAIDHKDASSDLLQYVRTFGCGRYEHGEE